MKSRWNIPLSAKDPGYQRELARCIYYNKTWDQLTDEERTKEDIPSLWLQRYKPKLVLGDVAKTTRETNPRKPRNVYGIPPMSTDSIEYRRMAAACRFFKKPWDQLTDDEKAWDPEVVGKSTQQIREQKAGYHQPMVVGDTVGKTGAMIDPEGLGHGVPEIGKPLFDARLQKVQMNCKDLCFVNELVTTLVRSHQQKTDAIKDVARELTTMNDNLKRINNAAYAMKAVADTMDKQTTVLGDLIGVLDEILQESKPSVTQELLPKDQYNFITVAGILPTGWYQTIRTTDPEPSYKQEYFEECPDINTIAGINERADELWKQIGVEGKMVKR